MSLSGIYYIRHIPTNHLYIGSSTRLNQRLSQHKRKLRANCHENMKLQRAWNKHGEVDFELSIIHLVENDEPLVWEQFWIDFLKPYFNLLKVAGSDRGYKHTPESRAKMTAARTPEILAKMRTARLGVKHDAETKRRIAAGNRGHRKPKSVEHRAKLSRSRAKTVTLISPDGEIVQITNMKAFCECNPDLKQSPMSAVARGEKPQYKGWHRYVANTSQTLE